MSPQHKMRHWVAEITGTIQKLIAEKEAEVIEQAMGLGDVSKVANELRGMYDIKNEVLPMLGELSLDLDAASIVERVGTRTRDELTQAVAPGPPLFPITIETPQGSQDVGVLQSDCVTGQDADLIDCFNLMTGEKVAEVVRETAQRQAGAIEEEAKLALEREELLECDAVSVRCVNTDGRVWGRWSCTIYPVDDVLVRVQSHEPEPFLQIGAEPRRGVFVRSFDSTDAPDDLMLIVEHSDADTLQGRLVRHTEQQTQPQS